MAPRASRGSPVSGDGIGHHEISNGRSKNFVYGAKAPNPPIKGINRERMQYGYRYTFSTWNIFGLYTSGKRDMIEEWMKERGRYIYS